MKRALSYLMSAVFLLSPVVLCADDAEDVALTTSERSTNPPELQARLDAAYEAAMESNPALATEAKVLDARLESFRKKLHSAMVEADPSLESVPENTPRHKAPFAPANLGK